MSKRTVYLKGPGHREPVTIEIDRIDFSPQSGDLMLNIKEQDNSMQQFCHEENRRMISSFFHNPAVRQLMPLQDPEKMIDFIADTPKNYNRVNEIMLRFLDGERIKQIPVKAAHKNYVLRYLASKFEPGKDYTEAQVNAVIDQWHTFGDYFILRRELADSGLLRRLPNGSKYWREIV